MQTQRIGTSAFICDSYKRFLIVRRSDNDEYLAGHWELPGGSTEFGEEPLVAIEREVQEECGLTVKATHPLTAMSYMMDPQKHVVDIIFLCKIIIDQPVHLSSEHTDFAWVTFEDLSSYKMTEYLACVIGALRIHPLLFQ